MASLSALVAELLGPKLVDLSIMVDLYISNKNEDC